MIKEILKFALPTIISRLSNTLLMISSVILLGYEGLIQLSAYGLANPIYQTIYLMAISYLLVFSVKAAKIKEDKDKLIKYTISSVIFGLMLSFVVIVAFYIVSLLLPYFGQNIIVSRLAGNFFLMISIGIPALLCTVILNQTLIIFKRSKFINILSFFQLVVGICSIYIFSCYLHLGLVGVAIGLSLSFWFKFLICSIYLICKGYVNFSIQDFSINDLRENIWFLSKLGWPVSLQYGGELIATIFSTFMIGHLYSNALAAQQISLQIRVLFIIIPYGLSQACVILIGKILKSESSFYHKDIINKIYSNTMKIGLLLVLITTILLNTFSNKYIAIFIHEPSFHIIKIAKIFILITSLSLFLDTIKYIVTGFFRALEKTRDIMKFSLLAYWIVGLPSAYFLGYHTNCGVIGIQLGMFFGLLVSVFMLLIYKNTYFKKCGTTVN